MSRLVLLVVAAAVLVAAASAAAPDGYAYVPGGRAHHKSCIHALPEDEHVLSKRANGGFTYKFANGSVAEVPPCAYPALPAGAAKIRAPLPGDTPGDGWQVYTYYEATTAQSQFNTFNGYWNVPKAPSTYDDQLLYLFTGLQSSCCGYGVCSHNPAEVLNGTEPEAFCEILQPVLNYGVSPAGGGQYWGMANWYVGSSTSFFSKLMETTPGHNLYGVMESKGSSWTCAFTDESTGQSTPPITADSTLVPYQKAAFVTLEAYDVGSCNAYPLGSSVIFDSLYITDSAGTNVTSQVVWQEAAYSSACSQNVVASGPTKVTINW